VREFARLQQAQPAPSPVITITPLQQNFEEKAQEFRERGSEIYL
jgi:hypothetical protein